MGNTHLGLVLRHHSQSVLLESDDGRVIDCKTRKKLGRIVSGDRVAWTETGPDEGVITRLEPRRSELTRPDHRNRPRPLAANIDLMLIVCAPEPAYSKPLIDRYLIAAELMPCEAAIVVNKADLLSAAERDRLESDLAEFVAIGYPLLLTSKLQPDSILALQAQLKDHTSILVGQSGVGKSSLVNGLLPEEDARVGSISESTGFGRHTTTETMLYHLPSGGHLIDSPGVRDFQLWHLEPEDLPTGFREFRPFIGACRFHNCRHLSEPGCAIQAAADRQEIAPRRLESYRQLHQLISENKTITY